MYPHKTARKMRRPSWKNSLTILIVNAWCMPTSPLSRSPLGCYFQSPELRALVLPFLLFRSIRAQRTISIPYQASWTSSRSWKVPRTLQHLTSHTSTGSLTTTVHCRIRNVSSNWKGFSTNPRSTRRHNGSHVIAVESWPPFVSRYAGLVAVLAQWQLQPRSHSRETTRIFRLLYLVLR